MARQRIVPAIPHQLTVRRAKVVPAGKNDQQAADDKGKSASLSTSADKPDVTTSKAAIQDENAQQSDESPALLNGLKDEQAKELVAEEEPVAIKEPAVNEELLEKEQLVENKEELPAEKEVVAEKKKEVIDEKKKEVNGKLYLPHVPYNILSNK
jgi:hypothetical protein